MQTNFLITGATGFVGSYLVRELIAMKRHVSIITRKKTLNWRLKDLASQLLIYECDLRSPLINQVINKVKPAYIFHLAAYGTLPDESDVEAMIDVNIKGTLNLIDALKNHKFKLYNRE